MASLLAVAKSVQLFRDEANAMLQAPLATPSADATNPTVTRIATIALQWMHRLVKVTVPKGKYGALLKAPEFAATLAATAAPSSATTTSPPPGQTIYRVATIRSVIEVQQPGSTLSVLLSLDFGDVLEMMQTKFISNELITDAELKIYLAICQRHHTADPMPSGDTLIFLSQLAQKPGSGRQQQREVTRAGAAAPGTSEAVVQLQLATINSLQLALTRKEDSALDEGARKRLREAQLEDKITALEQKNIEISQQLEKSLKEKAGVDEKLASFKKKVDSLVEVAILLRPMIGLKTSAPVAEILAAMQQRSTLT